MMVGKVLRPYIFVLYGALCMSACMPPMSMPPASPAPQGSPQAGLISSTGLTTDSAHSSLGAWVRTALPTKDYEAGCFGGSYESVVRSSHAFVGCYFRAPTLFLQASTPTNGTRGGQSEDGKITIGGQLEAGGAWFGASVPISMKLDRTYISVTASPTVRTRIAEPTSPHARAISRRAYTPKEFIGGAEDSMVLVPIGIAFYNGTYGLDLTFGWLMDKGDHGTELTGGISKTF